MKLRLPHAPLVLATLLAAAAACTGSPAGPDFEGPSGETGTTDKISLNGLVLHQETLARLSSAPLEGAAAEDLVATADGRALLEYVARCALPEGDALYAGGGEYPGLLGLAPTWSTADCDDTCQRWVTGCLLAHANMLGTSVPISLRGPHAALEPGERALDEFPVREAAFYGNAFAGDAEPQLFACVGDDMFPFDPTGTVDQVELEDLDSYLSGRLCGVGACGVTSTGVCSLPEPAMGACGFDAGDVGGYSECVAMGLYDRLYTEVVTVHLQD